MLFFKILVLLFLGLCSTMIRVKKNGMPQMDATYTFRIFCYVIAIIIATTL